MSGSAKHRVTIWEDPQPASSRCKRTMDLVDGREALHGSAERLNSCPRDRVQCGVFQRHFIRAVCDVVAMCASGEDPRGIVWRWQREIVQ